MWQNSKCMECSKKCVYERRQGQPGFEMSKRCLQGKIPDLVKQDTGKVKKSQMKGYGQININKSADKCLLHCIYYKNNIYNIINSYLTS